MRAKGTRNEMSKVRGVLQRRIREISLSDAEEKKKKTPAGWQTMRIMTWKIEFCILNLQTVIADSKSLPYCWVVVSWCALWDT